jgi:hypothetical protein
MGCCKSVPPQRVIPSDVVGLTMRQAKRRIAVSATPLTELLPLGMTQATYLRPGRPRIFVQTNAAGRIIYACWPS